MNPKQQIILLALLALVVFRAVKSGQLSTLKGILSAGGSSSGSGKLAPFMTKPNSASNPQANANGSLPGGSYPGLVQPGSPGSATNRIYGS